MPSTVSPKRWISSGLSEMPIWFLRLRSVGSMPHSSQSGFPTFMGVSTKSVGFSVVKENSQEMLDQSVTITSAAKIESFELKSLSK